MSSELVEEWRSAIEDYEISNLGNVRKRVDDNKYKVIQGSIVQTGYRYFQLQRDGKRLNYFYHKLVALAFLGPRPLGLVIDHIDRNRLNNCVTNLRYCTYTENARNSNSYLAHIEETDPIKRKKIVAREWRQKNKDKQREYNKTYVMKLRQKRMENEPPPPPPPEPVKLAQGWIDPVPGQHLLGQLSFCWGEETVIG